MIEFLNQFAVPSYVHGPLLLAVPGVPIQHIGDRVAQILGTCNPRKIITIQLQRSWRESEITFCKDNAFGLALSRVLIGAEGDLVLLYILLGYI